MQERCCMNAKEPPFLRVTVRHAVHIPCVDILFPSGRLNCKAGISQEGETLVRDNEPVLVEKEVLKNGESRNG